MLQFKGSATFADNTEIIVGEGAQLTVASIQDWAGDAVHITHHHAVIKRDGTLRHLAVAFGGDLIRMNTSVNYDGPGGSAELLGLYFADAGQHLENRLFVDHNAPRTKSNVDYKGALQGQGAHAVWIGDVLIRKVAEGIETYESNKNLVLTDGCRADSVPNLEIETGEIAGAGHASTTGRFDDEQLFYLRSRGHQRVEARRLVVHGFFADIIRKINVPEITEQLLAAVEAELAVTVGAPSRPELVEASRSELVEGPVWMSLTPRLRGRRTSLPNRPSRSKSTASRWPSCTAATSSTPCPTSARTQPFRCPKVTSAMARSSAICTGRASICGPAGRWACRPPNPYPSTAAWCPTATCSSTRPR